MAESTLSLDYDEIAATFARVHGWPAEASWSADQDADFAYCVREGLRRFYYPTVPDKPDFEWSFLRVTGSVSISSGTYAYDLPDDFGGIIIGAQMTLGDGTGYPKLKSVNEEELRTLKANDASSATPRYFAVRAKAAAPTTGHRWEVLYHPTPNATLTATFRYVASPDTISSVNKYPRGGAVHSQTIIASILAAGEMYLDNDPQGAWRQEFDKLLAASIRIDSETKRAGGN